MLQFIICSSYVIFITEACPTSPLNIAGAPWFADLDSCDSNSDCATGTTAVMTDVTCAVCPLMAI